MVATRVVAARRRPLAVPAIIAVAIAVAAIGFLGQKPVPPRPPTPPVEPTPTTPPVSVAWTEVTLDPAIFRDALVGLVVSTPGGLLAFGQDRTDRHPIAWTSPDGRAWVRHDQPPGTFGGGVPDAATRVGSTFAAVGYRATVNGTIRDIWTSPDGASWIRDPSPSGRGFQDVRALVGAGGTAVLVVSKDGAASLETSEDGQQWTPAIDREEAFGRDAYIGLAIASGDGYLAAGSIGADAAVWSSPTGRVWTRIVPADPSMFAGVRFERLMRTTAGFVLTGFSDSGGSAWASVDGFDWAPDATSSIGIRDIGAVLALDGGNLGIPDVGIGGGSGSLTVWVDPAQPGLAPTPADDSTTDWIRQATVHDGHLVLLAQHAATGTIGAWFGSFAGDGVVTAQATPGPSASQGSAGSSPDTPPVPSRPDDLTVEAFDWVRLTSHDVLVDDVRDLTMAGVIDLGPKLVAYGTVGTDAVTWTASDAGHWQRMPVSPSMRGAVVRSVAAAPNGWLIAVGATLGPDGQETPVAWTSPDGAAWKRVAVPRNGRGGEMSDVVAGPGGLVAVGWQDTDIGTHPAIWASANGSVWSAVPFSPGGGATGTIQAIAHAESGYVAVGTIQPDGLLSAGAAWTSADGRAWSSVADQVAFTPPPDTAGRGGGISLVDVVAGGPGLVAIGELDTRSGPIGVIFTSRDGATWARQAPDPVVAGAFLRSLTRWAGGIAIAANGAGFSGFGPARPDLARRQCMVVTGAGRPHGDPRRRRPERLRECGHRARARPHRRRRLGRVSDPPGGRDLGRRPGRGDAARSCLPGARRLARRTRVDDPGRSCGVPR